MEAHPPSFCEFVHQSLMSGNDGRCSAISKQAVTQALIMIHSLMQSILTVQQNTKQGTFC